MIHCKGFIRKNYDLTLDIRYDLILINHDVAMWGKLTLFPLTKSIEKSIEKI